MNQSVESNLTSNTIKNQTVEDDEYGTSVDLNLRLKAITNQTVEYDEYDLSLNGDYDYYGHLFTF